MQTAKIPVGVPQKRKSGVLINIAYKANSKTEGVLLSAGLAFMF
jgi:hypothetical protein